MRRFVITALVTTISFSTTPLFAGPRLARAQQQEGASLSGTASTSAGETLANVTVQLRNVATGQLAGSTTSAASGVFSFTGLQAGQYAVEVVNAAGSIVGTSAAITVAAGAMITGVTVTATAAVAAGAGAAAAGAAAAGGATGAGISTAVLVTTIAAAAGVAGVVAVATHTASPSR